MVPSARRRFNSSFDQRTYQAFLSDLNSAHPGAIEFRIAETPIFVPRSFGARMIGTCEHIIDRILDPGFKRLTERAIPASDRVPNENGYPHMISFDFGICTGVDGEPEPQLIEMQGFPSLYGFQVLHPEAIERHFPIPDGYSHFFNGYDRSSYIAALRDVIIGDCDPEQVILLEIRPAEQKTRIDFLCTRDYLGIETVCITELRAEGRKLYYEKEGRRIRVQRIYNRVIFDDLHAQRASLGDIPDITDPWDVTWVPHPNWFYRISKFTLPYISHPHVPATHFLNEIDRLPEDLENYVLKPLFSFAGQGVVIDVTKADVEAVRDPEHWILQRKVVYADVIETPDVPAKAEIRMMYLWKEGDPRPILATNLARLSKGKMIGVRYNKDKEWVGASVAYFEQ